MIVPGLFGITDSTINLVVSLLLLVVIIVWLALVYWTYADARRRLVDPVLIACATLASLFPFAGTLVYVIVRPPEYLDDVHERELEIQAAEARLHQLDHQLCPHCDQHIERDFLRCPHCLRKLKDPCPRCSRPLDPTWQVCPYCEAELRPASTAQRSTRRREIALEEPTAPAPAGIGPRRPAAPNT